MAKRQTVSDAEVDAVTDTEVDAVPEDDSGVSDTALKIQGMIFPFSPRYAEGHVLSNEEAKVMNQTLGENLRNNFASRIRAAVTEIEKATPAGEAARSFTAEELEKFQTDFTAYQSTYIFKAPRQGPGPLDPIEREMQKIAKNIILSALETNRTKVSTLPEGQMAAWIKTLCAEKPEIREEAMRRVEVTKSASSDLLATLGGLPTA